MSDADKAFARSIPEYYDTCMVPLIFKAYAEDMAERVASIAPMSVLETAAGSGVVPRALIRRLHPAARYVVTDLNQSMLDHATRRQVPDKRIEWRQADALDLPFEDDSFDAVICQFGAMFFPDRTKGYAEARRVLKKGGRFFFNVWDRIENNEFADVVTDAAGKMFPDDPPRFLARIPHGYFEHDLMREDLTQAGFSECTIVTKDEMSRAPSARQVAVAYCQGTPLCNEIEARDQGSIQCVVDSATAALEARFGKGAVAAKICAHIVTSSK
jgi:ubiquinone/menaquinone biosynthesis C-methylase UbiE